MCEARTAEPAILTQRTEWMFLNNFSLNRFRCVFFVAFANAAVSISVAERSNGLTFGMRYRYGCHFRIRLLQNETPRHPLEVNHCGGNRRRWTIPNWQRLNLFARRPSSTVALTWLTCKYLILSHWQCVRGPQSKCRARFIWIIYEAFGCVKDERLDITAPHRIAAQRKGNSIICDE